MQTQTAGEDRAASPRSGLHQEANALETLHRAWAQRVAAWQLAHQAAVDNATDVLARIDALITRLEDR